MTLSGTLCRTARRLTRLIAASYFLAGAVYGGWYLSQGYTDLIRLYLSKGSFYRDAQWTTDFFTEAVKQQGNYIAAGTLVASLSTLAYLIRSWRGRHGVRPVRIAISRFDVAAIVAIACVQVVLWWYGNRLLPPAYDEAFSALNAAGEGVFRSLSYYMLPNNHLLFNALNAAIFGGFGDPIFTGRVISLGAYIALGAVQYCWLRSVLPHRGPAVVVVVLLSVLLPVWGFAVQARGYLLLLLGSWLAFVGLWHYLMDGKPRWRWLFAGGCIVAYATVPVFLYVHVAMLCWILTDWISRRRIDVDLLISQLVCGVAVLVFYLPALTFSGTDAIIDNRYVAALTEGYGAFATRFLPTLPDYANYSTQHLSEIFPWLMPLLFLLPVLLWWRSSVAAYRRLARFQLLLVICTIAIVLLMRAVPFHRTLIFQLQFGGMVISLLLARSLLIAGPRLAAGVILLAAIYLGIRAPPQFSLHLYYYDIVPTHAATDRLISGVPPNAAVSFSDEAFYPQLLLQIRGGTTLANGPGYADYYFKERSEALPAGNFELVDRAADMELYHRLP